MLRVLIVEDNPEAAQSLRDCVERYCAERDLEVRVSWEHDALDLTHAAGNADLIFLDIELPLENGMDAATLLRTYDQTTPIVFVTNLAQYAVRGYEVDATDFIVKPVRYGDFKLRMARALRAVRRNAGQTFTVTSHGETTVIAHRDLVYAETSGHDITLHVDGREPITIRESLSKLEARLADGPFVCISSSCLVNMAYVRSVRGSEVRLTSGETFAISRQKRKDALAAINRYLGGSV